MSLTIEHRAAPREITVNNQTYVQLMEWKGTPIARGQLLNVSTSGALIHVDRLSGLDRPLWLLLERAPETGWIAADVTRFDSPQKVAIKFRSPCPLEFFLAATLRGDFARSAGREEKTPSSSEVIAPYTPPPGENRREEAQRRYGS
jgi:hypothetical protein